MRIDLLDVEFPGEDRPAVASLARGLAERGHEVTLACGAGRDRSGSLEQVAVARLRRPPRLPAQRFYEDAIELVPAAIWRLVRGRSDLAHAFDPALGWAAARARRFGGPPFAFSFRGPLTRSWLVDRHYRLEMMASTAAGAAVCLVDDADAAVAFRRYLQHEAEVIEPGAGIDSYEAAYARCLSA